MAARMAFARATPAGRCGLVLHALLAAACDKGDAARNDEVPAALRGNYGQKAEHAQLPSVGLEVDAHGLRLGELSVSIVQAEASGDEIHVGKAEAVWDKVGGKTKACKGTISRQGSTLLVKLFELDSDEHCESALEGEWKQWTRRDALPESMLGTYGADARSYAADVGVRVEAKRIGSTDGGPALTVNEVVQWVDQPNEAIVRDATMSGYRCIGSLVQHDAELTVTMKPAPGAAEGAVCFTGSGTKWTIDPTHVPTKAMSNGKVDVEPKDGKIVLVAKDTGLRCEQTVLRTSTRTITESQSDGLGVTGGALLVLEPAAPTGGTEACRERLRNVAQSECTEQNGAPCSPDELQAYTTEDLHCPSQLAIGEPTGGRRKAGLMHKSGAMLACWDMTGMFE